MNPALQKLLDELEPNDDAVQATESSTATIYAAGKTIELDAEACEKLLQTVDTVTQLFATLGVSKEDSSIELYSVSVDNDVFDKLEELFNSVDVY